MKARTLLRALALSGGAFAVGVWTTSGRGRELDDEVFDRVHATRGEAIDAAFSGLTELGSIWASVGGAAALVVFGGDGRPCARLLPGRLACRSWVGRRSSCARAPTRRLPNASGC